MFEPGSIVVLKRLPGAPQMLVMTREPVFVECVWFNKNQELQRSRFPTAFLKQVADAKDSTGEIPVVAG